VARTGAVSLVISGEDADNAQTYSTTNGDISSRASTAATVAWTPADWNTVGERGLDQQTENIAAIIQEIVDRAGWTSGDAIALTITGNGKRAAESFNGSQAGAPLLHIEYALPDDGIPRIDLDANDSSGAVTSDFAANFYVGTTPVAIADSDTLITDSDSLMLASATITITNPETGDALATVGELSGLITANLTANGTILNLTGPGTLAEYQVAIETVTFDNPLADPVASPRIVEVTVNDGTTEGLAATTMVNVVGPGFEFMVIADSPYNSGDFADLDNAFANMPAETQFVIHLGDIAGHDSFNPATYFPQVASTLQGSTVPLFIILGDNEYNDTPDPDAAFAEWSDTFVHFDQNWSHSLGVVYQDVRQENFSFVIDNTLFIGLNLVGSSVHDAHEWATRTADDLAWVEDMFGQFGATASNAVLFGYASPGHSGYSDFKAGFLNVAQDFQKPILYLQGDTHAWDLTTSYAEAPNITKVIVDQTNGSNAPLQVTVNNDPDDPFDSDHDFGGIFL